MKGTYVFTAYAGAFEISYNDIMMMHFTYFIRVRSNAVLTRLIGPYLNRLVGRPPQSGVQVKSIDMAYQAKSWDKPRRVIAKIEWHTGELFGMSEIHRIRGSDRFKGHITSVLNGFGSVSSHKPRQRL